MLKHYTLLVSGLLIALIGIICLQAYFAYNDFQVKTYEFEQEVDAAFETAILREKAARKDSFLYYVRDMFSDRAQVEISAEYDEKRDRTVYSFRDVQAKDPYTSLSFDDDGRKLNFLDSTDYELTIDRFIQSVASFYDKGSIYFWTKITGDKMGRYVDSVQCNENQLARFFEEVLGGHRIQADFQLQQVRDSLDEQLVPVDAFVTPSLHTQFRGDPIMYRAIIPNPFEEILARIQTTLIGSVLLILLTALSFYIMMRVILRQKKLSEIKDDFIDNITHELQTPIATLMAANEGMEKYRALEDPEKSKKYLSVSRTELKRLSKMVDHILMSSIHDREGFQFTWEWVDIHALLKERVEKFSLTSEADLHFKLDLASEDMHIYSDRFHLQNVVDNLIENAGKYNDAEQKKIDIQTRKNRSELEIVVADNGRGIPPEFREKVFGKFYRVPGNSSISKGFGIGLYYVKNILNQLKGHIFIDADRKNGSSFHIILPMNPHEV